MWYKTQNEELINLSLVTRIIKGKAMSEGKTLHGIYFYYCYSSGMSSTESTGVRFELESSRDMEYNKILMALKNDKVKVIV